MVNILLVEDEKMNLDLLKYYVNEYFDINNIDINIDLAQDGSIALELLKDKSYDLIILDVIMPNIDGFKVLNKIRKLYNSNKPYICMATAMGEQKHKILFKIKGANSYLIKPYDKEMITSIFDRFKTIRFSSQNIAEAQEDIEFDDFMDFDEDNELNEAMIVANQTAPKISAVDFIAEYGDIEHIIDIIDEADEDMEILIETLDQDNFHTKHEIITYVLSKYATFLNNFSDFQAISSSIYFLKGTIEKTDFHSLDNSKFIYVVEFIRAIFTDLKNWKINVFEEQIAVDVFYINASILSSCLKLQELMEN